LTFTPQAVSGVPFARLFEPERGSTVRPSAIRTTLRPSASAGPRAVRAPVIAIAALVAGASVAAEQPRTFKAGPVEARPGEIASGSIEIPAGVDAGTMVPVTVVRGAKSGPVLALIAGNHGYEYAPIIALQRLRSRLDPKAISGTVVMVHVANVPSFLKRTIYYGPADGKNLNRVYPGKTDGTVSERIAYAITHDVIEKASVVLDLHCGDGNESLRPYTYWDAGAGSPDVVEKSRQLALAFGFDHIVVDRERPRDPNASVYCSTTATTRGKPALTIESGALGQTDDEAVSRIVRGVENVMRHLRMIEGAAVMVEQPLYIDRSEVLRSSKTGIFYPLAERGHTVAQGTLLGYVTDFFGARTQEVRAPFAGEILYILGTPPVSEGEPLAMIGRVSGTVP
jgi:predicted deacylase